MPGQQYDVVVVGGGNAALCAALAAQERGASVLVLERAPKEENGGNSRFTAGAIRFAYNGVDDLREIMDLSESEIETTDFGTYTEDQFFDDMFRVTQYRSDPALVELLVRRSFDTVKWMRGNGVRFVPIYGRQAFKIGGRFKFWGGLTVESWGGGPGLVDSLTEACRSRGIEVRYSARATALIADPAGVHGVSVKSGKTVYDVGAKAVVLACGGFQANTEMRTRYMGPGWELAKIRGTRFNTGDGHQMALAIGASSAGNWSGGHAVQWDRNAPEFGDLAVGDQFQKHSYPFGILVNATGERFVDEGADFRNYTYAKYGKVVLEQPENFAWQVFDEKVAHLLRDEYKIRQVTKVSASSLEGLAYQLEGVNADRFLAYIQEYNAAVRQEVAFNPNVKDGRGTQGLKVDKSNWANTIDTPPFQAYQVTCGLTFTFGGLRIKEDAQVLDVDMIPIEGLYAAGEIVGGVFYFNYPGGTGLMNGAVFGRIAGYAAAGCAKG